VTYLPIWDVDRLAKFDSLAGCLRAATQDDRVRRPAYLLIRCETTAQRRVCVTTANGEQEATIHVQPAIRTPSIKHPLGHAPTDTVIGPVVGMITYLPTAGGLRVLAYEITGKDQAHGPQDR
jgi:hypothetical protein